MNENLYVSLLIFSMEILLAFAMIVFYTIVVLNNNKRN